MGGEEKEEQVQDREEDTEKKTMPSSRPIEFRIDAGVGFVRLNRPDVLNSFNTVMGNDLLEVLSTIETDITIRSVHLTGNGRAFCAGQDLADVLPKEGRPAGDLQQIVETRYNPIVKAIRRIEKPFVCAVNGVAAGAGANLALACDLTLASTKASFIQSFCKIGLVPDSGGTFFLPRLIGFQQAAAQMMLGEKVTAEIAVQLGLIYRCVSPEVLEEESVALAMHLAKQPTIGLGLTKRALNASMTNSLMQQLDLEATLQGEAGRTADYKEGVNAFVEKRPPVFVGR